MVNDFYFCHQKLGPVGDCLCENCEFKFAMFDFVEQTLSSGQCPLRTMII